MCGIAGFTSFKDDFSNNTKKWKEILKIMTDSIVHRGPDNQGLVIKENSCFGHQRLSIRDIKRGSQPMSKTIEGYDYIIVYNGEIYNTDELKGDLENKGHKFYTTCDTEVILIGMIEYGYDFISKLNGIFAYAFWNGKKEDLYLVRDRAGVKPLFYSLVNDYFVYGSEIKALLNFPYVEPIVDNNGLCEIFGLGPARTGGVGVFKNINEVMPGHYIVYNHSGIKNIEYWDLESKEHTDNYEATVEKVGFFVKDAVQKQMVSDVPVCTFLSGGVDSSIITAFSAEYLEQSGQQLDTYSFDFTGNDKYFKSNSFQADRDRPWVEKMVKHCNTKHTFLECNNENLADYLYKSVEAKDLPGMADVDSSLLYFCELVKNNHKVALTGECSDEIFGGYPWFHHESMFKSQSFPWSSDLEPRKIMLKDDIIDELRLDDYVQQKYWESIESVPTLDSDTEEEKRRRELAYLNIKWFMAALLDRMDRASMFSGLETRVPFADHRIMEYVFNVPWEIKNKNNTAKHLLRKSAEGLLPNELLYRKKSPYPKTYNPEYENILSRRLLEILADPNEPLHEFYSADKIKSFIGEPSDYGKPWYGQLMAGPQMLAYLLQVNYWIKRYKVQFV